MQYMNLNSKWVEYMITEIIIEPHTLQHILLHLNLIELIGANDYAVVGEVNTATGFQGLNLLKQRDGGGSQCMNYLHA